mmetsp:Transcript_42032/g.112517  ORF Transcript_42032/g.112517 Transcript_42032/m.112517 type:complete len:86 (+) Transcript_42032:330-587(+)
MDPAGHRSTLAGGLRADIHFFKAKFTHVLIWLVDIEDDKDSTIVKRENDVPKNSEQLHIAVVNSDFGFQLASAEAQDFIATCNER